MKSPGRYLELIGQRLTRPDTFERMVSPAIADLQREAGRGVLMRARHAVAVGSVIIWALVIDLRTEAIMAFDVDARRTVWRRAAWWYAGSAIAIALLASGNVPWQFLDAATRRAATLSTVFTVLVGALAPATAAATFYLWRRTAGALRPGAAATLLMVAATAAAAMATDLFAATAQMQLYHRVAETIPAAASNIGDPDYRWHTGWAIAPRISRMDGGSGAAPQLSSRGR